MTNEEQGTKETEGEGDEQSVDQSPVVGLDYESVSMLHKNSKNNISDDRETQSHVGKGHSQRILKRQECYDLREAVISLTVCIFLEWALVTGLCIWGKQHFSFLDSSFVSHGCP